MSHFPCGPHKLKQTKQRSRGDDPNRSMSFQSSQAGFSKAAR
jgi:hypothetical protein